jgi:hypothetical protein
MGTELNGTKSVNFAVLFRENKNHSVLLKALQKEVKGKVKSQPVHAS